MTPEGRAQWLREVKNRVNNATPEPWSWGWNEDANPPLVRFNEVGRYDDPSYGVVGPDYRPVAITARERQGFLDAEFIAHARQDIPRLLAYIEELGREGLND